MVVKRRNETDLVLHDLPRNLDDLLLLHGAGHLDGALLHLLDVLRDVGGDGNHDSLWYHALNRNLDLARDGHLDDLILLNHLVNHDTLRLHNRAGLLHCEGVVLHDRLGRLDDDGLWLHHDLCLGDGGVRVDNLLLLLCPLLRDDVPAEARGRG